MFVHSWSRFEHNLKIWLTLTVTALSRHSFLGTCLFNRQSRSSVYLDPLVYARCSPNGALCNCDVLEKVLQRRNKHPVKCYADIVKRYQWIAKQVNLAVTLHYVYSESICFKVSIETDYGLDSPGSNSDGNEIFRPSRPALRPTHPPVKWVPCLSRW